MSAQPDNGRVVDVKLTPPWSWVSYVGSVTSVLRSRGVKCDFIDVAGMSGYAFIVNIHPEVLPSGPVAFDWEVLIEGTQALGIEAQLIAVAREDDDREALRELFERVRAEIDAGRCCIVWGAGEAPEFGIVYGYQGEEYLVRSSRSARGKGTDRPLGPDEEPEAPVRFDRLKALWRLAALFFGEKVKPDSETCERRALGRAVKLLRGQDACFDADYHYGAGAFRTWADVLERGRVDPVGNFYNLMCYWELQMFAAGFCERLAKKWRRGAEPLQSAARLFLRSFQNLDRLQRTLATAERVEPGEWAKETGAPQLLIECATLNEQAAAALERALGLM